MGLYASMSSYIKHLIELAEIIGAHENISHWAVSMRVTGKGDLIDRLKKGGDVRTATYEGLMRKFSQMWPADLEWPRHITRPSKSKDAA
ncbi:MAG: hypothetical protein Q4G49_03260 [Paracoccus sp. (in: a-proteobacteria)]|nr:hypothetical protein [Paracoccus sp. (in: a-proteobacteria)]